MTKTKVIKFLKRLFLILFVVGFLIFYFIFPRFIIETRNPIIESFKTQNNISSTLKHNDNAKFKRKKIVITTEDDLKQYAILTYSSLPDSKGTIILVHGSSHTKEHFQSLSEILAINGFNSVAVDLRGFGESEGRYFTFGVKETKDIQKLIDNLITIEGLDNIGIWGQSIGGALALQAMGSDQRISYGISESAYTDLKSNIQAYFKRHTGFQLDIISNFMVNRAGSIADFDPDEASPINYSKKITQPVRIVHGSNDAIINIANGKANFANLKSTDKEFIAIDSAGHSDIWEVGGETYFNLILQFLNEQAAISDNRNNR